MAHKSIWIVFCLSLLGFLIPLPSVSAAGTVSTCNEASLNAALSGGGTITFTCSGTITFTTTKTISTNTIIDGSGQNVIFSGANARRLFIVNAGISFELNNLTLQNGYVNSASTTGGAGVYGNTGSSLTVTNSVFSNNRIDSAGSAGGGAIDIDGTLTISGSQFTGNQAGPGGAVAIENNGSLTITTSSFTNNLAAGAGGAVFVSPATLVTISDTSFTGNTAQDRGGALRINNLTLIRCTFTNNNAQSNAGAVYSFNTITIIDSTFTGNSSGSTGSTIYHAFGAFSISGSTFSNNGMSATSLIHTASANSMIINSTFSANTGPITNSTSLSNMTITSSTFKQTGTLFFNGGSLTISNSIIDLSGGGTCPANIANGGNNIGYPSACGAIPAGGNPLLGALGNNGGTTLTHLPGGGSAALNLYSCTGTDQRGINRPQGAFCDAGSVEVEVTPTDTPSDTATFTPSDTVTNTPTDTPSDTATFTPSDTMSDTPTDTPTDTATVTPSDTASDTPTDTFTPSDTASDTPLDTPTNTATFTPTDTATFTPSNTASNTPSDTPTDTATFTPSQTFTPSVTACVISVTAPSLISPIHRAHTTDTTPTFSWSQRSGAQSYRLMVYLEDRSFEYKKRLLGVTNTSYTLTSAEALTRAKYLWRVRTQDQTCSTWSLWSQRNTLFID